MKIGVFKPGKAIYFYKNQEDHASWSQEITKVISLFVKHDHEVYILSKTDYNGGIPGVFVASTEKGLDKIFVFNGVWTHDEETMVNDLKSLSKEVNFVCTDLKLMTRKASLYEKIFTCSNSFHMNSFMYEVPLIDNEQNYDIDKKDIKYYFGGTERGRTLDFFEYVIRPGCEWYGKSESLGVVNYIPYDEHIEKLKKAITTIIIADEEFNETGFLNQRYYECAMLGVICFVDSKVDPDELIIKKSDWRRVSSYRDLLYKQKRVEEDPELYKTLLSNQFVECRARESGINIYNALMQ